MHRVRAAEVKQGDVILISESRPEVKETVGIVERVDMPIYADQTMHIKCERIRWYFTVPGDELVEVRGNINQQPAQTRLENAPPTKETE